jgi:hypothetical protein
VKFFVDENETSAIVPPLRLMMHQHEFRYANEEHLVGVEDIELFKQVASRGFDAIITRDRNQLSNRDERETLIATGLHWIGHAEPSATGELLIACLVAGYIIALPHIVELLPTLGSPHSFHVRNVEWQQGQRVKHRPLRP